MAGFNRDGAAGTLAAMQAAAHPGSDTSSSSVDRFARDAAVSAHNRLDNHDSRLAALEHGAGVADEALDPNSNADS